MQAVAIVGVGLIGGSFALGLRKAGFTGRITGVSSPSTIEQAVALRVIDSGASLEDAVSSADLVYLAQPIHAILETIERIAPSLRPGALVTDAGSTKTAIVERASRHLPRKQFLGGHPMAGKETRGVAEAEADLFHGRPYVLTPTRASDLDLPAFAEFVRWIRRMGASPLVFSPEQHDRVVAMTSHLPQLASTALASTLAAKVGSSEYRHVAGPGLLDQTRLALSSFDLWHQIFTTNLDPVRDALATYIQELQQIHSLLHSPNLQVKFKTAAQFAKLIRDGNSN